MTSTKKERTTHVYFVLDRSGSMATMANDVIGGFNSFITEQAAEGNDAIMTLIQFDSGDAHEVLASATPMSEVPKFTPQTFCPRGSTPLYDAMGHAIADATIRGEQLASLKQDAEEIIFITFTDGEENASSEYTHEKLFELIKQRETENKWTFVYMGANQDSYLASGRVGFSAANVQDFAADGDGAKMAFRSLSDSTANLRGKIRDGKRVSNLDFFEGDKSAEVDKRTRGK